MAENTNIQASGAASGAAPGGGAPTGSAAPTSGKRPVKIVGIVCNWCSYAGADTAGVGRFRQPPNVRLVRVPCTGRIDPLFALKAFQKGADGVLISGCHPGDCHYSEGNYYARRRFELLERMVHYLGIPKERFRWTWVSASEGQRWQQVVSEFVAAVEKLGPREGRAL
ncbi:MAG: hydrogenase iron-sulfur subunit [Thermoleophilia bacterium]|nr:hydrogenase iron-sulfur subunit [Thermoleophilia bacterium]